MSDKNWRLIDWSSQNFWEFYSNYCGSSNRCILRFSIINPLKWKNANIPYLEWKITSSPSLLPLRYSRIESTWKAYGFSRDLEIRVPQDTVPEALDFTVFQ
jgi:hypothetical protein